MHRAGKKNSKEKEKHEKTHPDNHFVAMSATGWAGTVAQDGSGDYTSIQAAIDAGETLVTIIDSAVYDENVRIGDLHGAGTAVTLTSNKSGADRPTLSSTSPSGGIASVRNNENHATLALLANGSTVSNMILEGNPDVVEHGQAAIFTMADDLTIENCLIRPTASATGAGEINFPNSLIFVAMEGDPNSHVATPNGKLSDNLVFRNCELYGVPAGAVIEPTVDNEGYLLRGENSNAATLARCDHYTDAGQDCTVTFDGCTLAYGYDAGLFPSNRDDDGSGLGSVTWVLKNCLMDSFGKFGFRGRGVNLVAECTIFTRTNMGNHGDGENSAIAIQTQDGRSCDSTVTNCLFVNCGGAFGKKAYFGGCNNHNAGTMTVEQSTFVSCLTGVGVGTGGDNGGTTTIARNCIFQDIGSNLPGAVDFEGITIDATNEDLVDGLYPVWDLVTIQVDSGAEWSAVFNHHKDNSSTLVVDNCLVGDIMNEDVSDWDTAFLEGLTGCRLTAGYTGPDESIQGIETVTRATPVFANTDLDADNPYELAAGSPGQGLGVQWSACETPIDNWSVY